MNKDRKNWILQQKLLEINFFERWPTDFFTFFFVFTWILGILILSACYKYFPGVIDPARFCNLTCVFLFEVTRHGHKSVTYKTETHPPPLPSSKEIWSTIKYDYWLKVKPPPISDVICLLPYFSHWIITRLDVFKGKTSDAVMFE